MSVRGKATGKSKKKTPLALAHPDLQIKIQQVSVKDLVPYARNARLHSEDQVKQLAASISRFGFVSAVLVDADTQEIIAGHGRVLAAQALKMPEVPVIYLSHLDAGEKRALRLADNKIAQNSKWDAGTLKTELEEIKQLENGGELFEVTGFDSREMRGLDAQPLEADKGGEGHGKAGDTYRLVVTLPSAKKRKDLAKRLREEGYECHDAEED